jgi:hypothetical protein
LKLLEETIGEILQGLAIGNDLENRTLIAQERTAIFYKWDYIKLRNFCIAKEMIEMIEVLYMHI